MFANLILSGLLSAQVALTGGTYTQSFNTATAAVPAGWLFAETGTNANAAFSTGTGTSTAGDTYFFGSAGEWAFGGLQSGSLIPTVGVAFTNNTGGTITALTIAYTGETWRIGGTNRSDRIDFQYSTNATSLTTGTWTDFDALDYADTPSATVPLSGSMQQSAAISATITGLSIPNGATFYLRWNSVDVSGSDDGLAVDDFSISTVGGGGGPVAPSIGVPPASQTVTEGALVQFTVTAGGTSPLSYQWRKDGSPLSDAGHISGALSDTLALNGAALADAGSYDVVVANAGGSVTSAPATLTVNPLVAAPSITAQPASQSASLGGTASFAVAAAGTAPLSYQWRKNGNPLSDGGNISGALSPTLTISSVSAADLASYEVVVTNSAGFATSNSVALSLAALVTPTGRIAYTGGSYVQNFDTLPAGGTYTLTDAGPLGLAAAPIGATGLGGWSLAKYAGSGSVALFRVDAGSGTSGSVYSYGSASAADRALGSLSSGSTVSRFGATLVNSTGRTITQFTLSYAGEQWRRGSGAPNRLAFEYALDPADLNTGDYQSFAALDFTAPVTTGGGALDGNAPVNRAAVGATVAGLNWLPGQTLVLRWTDVDDTGSDDGLAIDDLSFSTPVSPGDILPAVIYTIPADGTVNVPVASPVTVTFNEAVNFTSASFSLTGDVNGAYTTVPTGGPVSYTLTPSTSFAEGETVNFHISAAQVTDAATGSIHPGSDHSAGFVTYSSAPLPIHTVQGSGSLSPYKGLAVTVQGVVVGGFQAPGGIGGYYLEAPDAQQDANPATSEGIYVFDNANAVAVGDLVTITGTVSEFLSSGAPATMSETEIGGVTAFARVSSGNALPAPVAVTLPFASLDAIERFEGMRVVFPQDLTVTDNYDLGHFGEVLLSHGRLPQPTNIVAPGAPAQAQEAANRLNQIVLDDGLSQTYPSPTPYLNGAAPLTATRRTGSTAGGVTGILDNRFGTYVVEPTATPLFAELNPRPAAPASAGSLRVVFGNVENFMNGDGVGGGFPTSRGATTFAEYQAQLAKVTAAILSLAPDVMGISEMENDRITDGSPDSYGAASALAQLVANLNANAPAGTTYAFVNAAAVDIVTDLIHSAIIYRVETVEPVGAAAVLDNVYFNNHARNPLAQTFREKATGAKFTLCVNHFRAKASASSLTDGIAPNPNNDQGDGQGTNNYLRTKEAQALTAWLATDPTGSGDARVLIVGDLNAYAKEDPLVAIAGAGYVNLAEQFEGEGGYSYAFNGEFGHLDHALASPALAAEVLSTATWHANSDEPVYYDYNTENKDAAQLAINAGTPYRYADHDPVVIGLKLTAPPQITSAPVAQTITVGDSVTFSVAAIGSPTPTYQWRRNGAAIPGATGASYTIVHPTTADAGSYDVVIANSVGSVASAPVALTVNPAAAVVTLGNLLFAYDGTPHAPSAVTVPAGLPVTVTYDGGAAAPVYPGAYAVVATIDSPDYVGSVAGTLIVTITSTVRHAPTLNGALHGSLQLLLPESVTLNGGADVSGDLLVPGTPSLRLNGHPAFGGTVDGDGAAAPTTHTITLNGGSTLGHLVRRIDATGLPTVAAPPAPTGTRNVSLNSASQSPGDFATVRNLTLNGNAGSVAVPPGTYGAFTANGSGSLVLGVAGATEPAVYNLQALTLNGGSRLVVVGPVALTLATGVSLNGDAGNPDHPEWLDLAIAAGGLTLNGNVDFSGFVTAPGGAVTINGSSVLLGGVQADRLTINGNGLLIDAGP